MPPRGGIVRGPCRQSQPSITRLRRPREPSRRFPTTPGPPSGPPRCLVGRKGPIQPPRSGIRAGTGRLQDALVLILGFIAVLAPRQPHDVVAGAGFHRALSGRHYVRAGAVYWSGPSPGN